MIKLFCNRNVTLLFIGQVISQAGDSIFRIGLLWLVLDLTGSKSLMGFMAMASFLPALLFSLPAGTLADRFHKIKILQTVNIACFFFVLLIPGLHYFEFLSITALACITFLVSTGSTLFHPARDALIPEIASREELNYANTLIQTSWQFALLIGPALGAVLLSFTDQIHLFTFDAFTFLISFIVISFIVLQPKSISTSKTTAWEDMKEGAIYVWKTPLLKAIVIITVINNLFLMGPAIVGMPIFIKEILHLDISHYALAETALAGGIIVGIPLIVWIGHRTQKMGKVLLWGLIFDGLTHCPIYFLTTFRETAIVLFIHSFFIPMVTVSRTTLIQQSIPTRLQGRIFSIIHMCVIGSTALSVSLTGILAEYIAINVIYLYSGLICASAGVIGFLLGIHRH